MNTIQGNTISKTSTIPAMTTATTPLFIIQCQALLTCATPPPIASIWPIRLLLTLILSTIPLTYTISPRTGRGNAFCIMTTIQMRVNLMWQIPMCVLLSGFLSQSRLLEKTKESAGGRRKKVNQWSWRGPLAFEIEFRNWWFHRKQRAGVEDI